MKMKHLLPSVLFSRNILMKIKEHQFPGQNPDINACVQRKRHSFLSAFLLAAALLIGVQSNSNAQVITYSQSFTGGATSGIATPQGIAWTSFCASLPSSGCLGFTIKGSNDLVGISCTNAAIAQSIADAMRTNIFYSGSSDGQTWSVGFGCGGGVEITNTGTCSCNPGYTVRPNIGNSNWGGINGATCGAPTQTMTVVFRFLKFNNPNPQALSVCQNSGATSLNSLLTATGAGTFTWTVVTGPGHGTLGGFTATAAGGTSVSPAGTTYTPAAGYSGTDAFTIQVSDGTSVTSTVIVVNVIPFPSSITGTATVCQGATTLLSDSKTGGTWSTSATTIATVGSANGIVSGVSGGTATISYSTGCGTAATQTVTVYPTPTVLAIANQTVCNGLPTTAVTFSGTGTSYNWTNNNTSIGLAASGTGNISSFLPVNPGTLAVTANIMVTPSANGCAGAPQSFAINVNPTPTVANPPTQTVCNGNNTSAVIFSGTVGGTTYTWTNNNSSIGLAAAGSGNIAIFTAVNSGTAAANANIIVTPTANGCSGTPKSFTITVNPTPTVNVPFNQIVCNGDGTTAVTFSGAVAGTTYSWTNSTAGIGLALSGTGNIASFTAVNSGTAAITTTVTVTPSANSCPGTSKSFTITVNPTPTVNPTLNQTLCNGDATGAVTFAGAVTGTTYTWTNNNTSIGLAASGTGNIASFTAGNIGAIAVTATVTATPSANGCTGAPGSYTITVNPTPTVAIPPNQTVCNGDGTTPVTYSGAVAGTNYTWTNNNVLIGLAPSGVGNIASFPANNSSTSAISGTITVTPSANGCFGTPQSFKINVNPTPTVSGFFNQTVCNGDGTTAELFSGSVSGTTYNWVNSDPTIGLASTGTGNILPYFATNSGTAAVTANIDITPSANGCNGPLQSFSITVNPTPDMIGGTGVVCESGTTTLTETTALGTWSSSNTSVGSIDAGTGILSGVAAGTTTITYQLSTGCFNTMTALVNPLPSAILGNTGVCQGLITTLSDAGGGSWSSTDATVLVGAGSGDVVGMAVGTATITYTLPTSCATTTIVTVNPLPSSILGTPVVCKGLITTLNDAGGGTWNSGDATVTVNASTGDVTGVTAGTATITYTLPVTGCIATTEVTVNPLPAAITGNPNVCFGLVTNLSDATGTGSWSSSDATVIVGTAGDVSGVMAGTATVTYTIPTGCIMTALITVNPLPAAISGTTTICSAATSALADAGGGTWNSSNTAVASVNTSTGVVIGMSAGTALITYTLPTTCIITTSVNILPLPAVYTVMGGGGYCAGGTGLNIDLSMSDTGFHYQLYKGLTAIGSSMAGADSVLHFGLQTAAGSYTIVATNDTTSCNVNMSPVVNIVINPLPSVYNVTGGGTICSGDGIHVGLSGSDWGIKYQLYNGSGISGSPLLGTNTTLDYGLQTLAGTYTVAATDTMTKCTNNMSGHATVIVNPLLTPLVSIYEPFNDTVCKDKLDTFTAIPTYAGPSPFYQWSINGKKDGYNSPVYTATPQNGDVITVTMISDTTCLAVVPGVATGEVTMEVEPVYIPEVKIYASKGVVIAKGTIDTLTAVVTNAGPSPRYIWLKNGTVISGVTSSAYSSTFNNKDSITCVVFGTGRCSQFTPSFNSVIILTTAGIEVLHSVLELSVLPNPSKGAFNIKGTLGTINDQEVFLEVTNMLGQVIYNDKVISHDGEIAQQVNLGNNIASGMYLLNVRSGDEHKVFRIVVE